MLFNTCVRVCLERQKVVSLQKREKVADQKLVPNTVLSSSCTLWNTHLISCCDNVILRLYFNDFLISQGFLIIFK